MKATLEFDLPEDQYEFDLALGGAALQAEMRAFEEWMRDIERRGGASPTQQLNDRQWSDAVAFVRQVFLEHVEAAGGFVEG